MGFQSLIRVPTPFGSDIYQTSEQCFRRLGELTELMGQQRRTARQVDRRTQLEFTLLCEAMLAQRALVWAEAA